MTTSFSSSSNAFGIELFKKIYTDNNLSTSFSPFSLYVVLSMVLAIAQPNAAQELLKVFGLSLQNTPQTVIDGIKELIQKIECQTPLGKITGANSIWIAESLKEIIKPEEFNVLQPIQNAFNYTIFPQPGVDQINSYVSDKTNALIPNLLSPESCSTSTSYVLVNCLYFIDKWENAFSKDATYKSQFHAWSKDISCQMMSMTKNLSYFEDENFQVVKNPYKTTNTSMMIFLPKNPKDPKFFSGISASYIDKIGSSLSMERINLHLPKFTARTKWDDLQEGLKLCGINQVFDMPCLPGGTHIYKVIQEAVVIADEEKTEAAAATAVLTKRGFVPSIPVIGDHPFAFFIIHEPTNSILFMGVINDPTN